MSIAEALLDKPKPWLNVRFNSQAVDQFCRFNETTAPTGAAGKSLIYADSTGHDLRAKIAGNTAQIFAMSSSSGTGTAPQFVTITATSTTNQLLMGVAGQQTVLNGVQPTATRTYSIQDVGANCDVQLGIKKETTIITGVTNLSIALSGYLLGIDSSGGACTINLPAVASSKGVHYRFYWKVAGNNSTVASAAANQLSGIIINAATSILTNPNNKQTITFVSGTAAVGDYVDVCCPDGARWQILGATTVNGGITIA